MVISILLWYVMATFVKKYTLNSRKLLTATFKAANLHLTWQFALKEMPPTKNKGVSLKECTSISMQLINTIYTKHYYNIV